MKNNHVDAPAVKALTTHEMADALGCFWNAALGEAHNKQDSTAFAVASIMAEGFAAVERRLREFSTLTPAPSQPDGEIERFHFTRRDGFTTIQLHADETFVRLSDYERLKFALKTAKTEAEYLAGKVERAESRAEALSKELADHLQARFDLELDAYAKDSDMAALRSLVAEYLKLHPDIHKGLNYRVRDTATANRLSELAGKARSLLNGEKAK